MLAPVVKPQVPGAKSRGDRRRDGTCPRNSSSARGGGQWRASAVAPRRGMTRVGSWGAHRLLGHSRTDGFFLMACALAGNCAGESARLGGAICELQISHSVLCTCSTPALDSAPAREAWLGPSVRSTSLRTVLLPGVHCWLSAPAAERGPEHLQGDGERFSASSVRTPGACTSSR